MQYVLVNTVPFPSLFFSVPFAKNSLLFIPEGKVFTQNSFNFKTLYIATTFFTRQQPGKLLFFNGAETNCGIVHILDILLMNSSDV